MNSKTKFRTFYTSFVALVVFIFCISFINTNYTIAFAQTNGSSITLDGDGSKELPYLINNLEELEFFRDDVNSGNTYQDKYIKLNSDIDLSSVENWTPIGTQTNSFNGNFDGGNFTISNLKIIYSKEYVSGGDNKNYIGFFGNLKGGSTSAIKNLIIENANVSGCLYVGVVLGRSYIGGIIENCHVKGEIKVDAYSYAGVIVGRHEYSSGLNSNNENFSIYNCSVNGVKENSFVNCDYPVSYVGGIVGFLSEGDYVLGNLSVENIEIKGVYGVGGISGIGHYGNTFKDVAVESVSVVSIDNDTTSTRTGNVGLIIGACQGSESSQTIIKNYEINQSTLNVNGENVEIVFGNNINGEDGITNFVAKIGNLNYYESLEEAVKNATFDDTITLIKNVEETINVPAGIKLESNGYNAPNVSIESLLIKEISAVRNSENTATIITITYTNSEKITQFTIFDGTNGENGIDGVNGVDGIDGKNGKDSGIAISIFAIIISGIVFVINFYFFIVLFFMGSKKLKN